MAWIFFMCFLSLFLHERPFPHSSHFNLLSIFSSSDCLHLLSCLFILDTRAFIPQLVHFTVFVSPCMFLMCLFKNLFTNVLEQMLHKVVPFSVPSSSWALMWYLRLYLLLKVFWHTWQKWFSPWNSSVSLEWLSMCVFKMYLLAKVFEQTLQSARSLDAGLLVWAFMWVFSTYLFENILEQLGHSIVWSLISSSVFKCDLEWFSTHFGLLKHFPHCSQGYRAFKSLGGE